MTLSSLLRGEVLGDGLGSFGDPVLREFARKDEECGSLDVARAQGLPLAQPNKLARLRGQPLEVVVGNRVHDTHCLGADADVRMNLLEDLVEEGSERQNPLLLGGLQLLRLVNLTDGSGRLRRNLFERSLGGRGGDLGLVGNPLRRHRDGSRTCWKL